MADLVAPVQLEVVPFQKLSAGTFTDSYMYRSTVTNLI